MINTSVLPRVYPQPPTPVNPLIWGHIEGAHHPEPYVRARFTYSE
jgi:hypothetical protein